VGARTSTPAAGPFTEELFNDNVKAFPRTSVFIVYGCMIAIAFFLSIYLLVIAIHESNEISGIDRELFYVQVTDVELARNLTILGERLVEAKTQLIPIEEDIDVLQGNVTSLQQRIDDLECVGIRSIEDVVTSDFYVFTGIPEFIVIQNDTGTNEIIINATGLQLLLNAQGEQLVLLDAFVTTVGQQLDRLESQTLKTIDMTPGVMNNINFTGLCNATATPDPGNNAVLVGACQIQEQIDQEFQVIFVDFQDALQKIAYLNGNITFINAQITVIEGIIANITQKGLFRLNKRLPDGGGTVLVSGDDRIDVTTGPASNEITLENTGVRTINTMGPFPDTDTGNFIIEATNGLNVTSVPPGTIRVDNTLSPKKCTIYQTALNVITTALPGVPIVGPPPQTLMDVGFVDADTVAQPLGCANTDGVFRRFAIATPFISIINQVCIPEGKWMLTVNADMITWAFTPAGGAYMSVVIGLGSAGALPSNLPLGGWDVNTLNGVPTSGKLSYTFTLTVPPPNLCLNVTWSVTNVFSIGPTSIVSRWSLIELN
jgi:hypothetical protein